MRAGLGCEGGGWCEVGGGLSAGMCKGGEWCEGGREVRGVAKGDGEGAYYGAVGQSDFKRVEEEVAEEVGVDAVGNIDVP